MPYIFSHSQNESEFRHQLRIVRSQQMGFLSAASMSLVPTNEDMNTLLGKQRVSKISNR